MASDTEGCHKTPRTQLELAIKSNSSRLVKQAIEDGADVNERNSEGDTALHLAISKDADIDVLDTLMAHGASISVKNSNGDTPVDCLITGSLDTILKLLELENKYDFRDRFGNTLIHVLLKGPNDSGCTEIDIEPHFWTKVFSEFTNLNIDLNAQNKMDQTPLHVSAGRSCAAKHLEYILMHFDNLNLLLFDSRGDTFMHVYFSYVVMEDDFDFVFNLLEGKLQNCPKQIVNRLMLCQNGQKNTPLHSFLKNAFKGNELTVDILQAFVDAGADVNLSNNLGETALHCVIRDLTDLWVDEEQEENIRYLVTSGANINAQDGNGESPIFYTMKSKESMRVLLDMGAEVNIRNKFGQTVLFSHLHDLDIVEMLLVKGVDINAQDINGSNILHYVAWNGDKTDIVPLMQQYGVTIAADKHGQLPCHVAYRRRNKALFDALCSCDGKVHKQGDTFSYQEEMIKYRELELKQSKEIKDILKPFQRFRRNNVFDLLELPDIGVVVFKKEAGLVRSTVTDLIANICAEIADKDEILSNTLIQSGSVGENTKVGLPDEFDFVCIFDKLGEMCYIDEQKTANDPGFAYLKLKENDHQSHYLFNEDGHLDTSEFWEKFKAQLSDILQRPDTFSHPNVWFSHDNFKSVYSPTCQFTIRWSGCFYKDLEIDIDLVPACQVKGWWPQHANIQSLSCDASELEEEGSLLLLQTEMAENFVPVSKLRISAMTAEKKHMGALPQIARNAYITSKILCDNRICPSVLVGKVTEAEEAKEYLTSYLLKNCMFHVFNSKKSYINQHCSGMETRSDELFDFVLHIFRTLLQYIRDENLPSFIFPWQNIFTFQMRHIDQETNHRICTHRNVFAKIILTILGELQDLKDVDSKCLFGEHK